MWIFTKYGFFSTVCARKGDGSHRQPVDLDRIMVRARVRHHLEAMQERFPDLLGGCAIVEFPGADYAFRLFVDKAAWRQVLTAMAGEMDYDNFKDEVARLQGDGDSAYHDALHDVWRAMRRLQKDR